MKLLFLIIFLFLLFDCQRKDERLLEFCVPVSDYYLSIETVNRSNEFFYELKCGVLNRRVRNGWFGFILSGSNFSATNNTYLMAIGVLNSYENKILITNEHNRNSIFNTEFEKNITKNEYGYNNFMCKFYFKRSHFK
jgi:hypothetical protein